MKTMRDQGPSFSHTWAAALGHLRFGIQLGDRVLSGAVQFDDAATENGETQILDAGKVRAPQCCDVAWHGNPLTHV